MTAVMNRLVATGEHFSFMHLLSLRAPHAVFLRTETLPNLETYESIIAALQPPVNHEVVSEYQNGTSRAL